MSEINLEPQTLFQAYKSWMSAKTGDKLTFDGLDLLNKSIGDGFSEETLNLIVAESGFGKTNFMIFQMLQFALFGAKTIFVSCELTRDKLIPRIVASIAKIPVWQIMKWKEEGKYAETMQSVEKILETIPLRILFTQSIEEIYHDSLKLRLENYKYLFIDHFSELTTSSKEIRNDYDKELFFIRVLEQMYKQDGFTIFMACQFKKGGERGVEHGLRNQDDVRGASELVKKANTLLYLYETKKMKEQREMNFINKISDAPSGCVLKLLKAREGHEGQKIKLDYFRSAMQFKLSSTQIIE